MEIQDLDPRLRLIQDANFQDKVVLVRFDHNVVKDGEITDPYRIDRTLGTLYNIVERGGRPILMTHIGRPKNKKTGAIECKKDESVEPIVEYLSHKLHIKLHVPPFHIDPILGIQALIRRSTSPYVISASEK
jgi:phosphoglycerate kinase